MTPEELDEARVEEARRRWNSNDPTIPDIATGAARLARENWTPPEPVVDPDLLIAREAAAQHWEQVYGDKSEARRRRDGWCDAGQAVTVCRIAARMAREQERERANHPIAFAVRVMAGVFKDLDHAKREARAALAKYRGEA